MPAGSQIVWLGVAGLGLASLLAWFAILPWVDLDRMTDLGLVSVLPAGSYVAFALLAAAWAWTLAQARFPTWLAALLVIVLIIMLYGLAPTIEGVPRFSPTWRHLGIVDYITRHGDVKPTLDAYHNWPGLFVVTSVVATVAGLADLTNIVLWAPVWLNLAYLPALVLLFRSLTDDRRLAWLAVWLFYLTDWIGQDYYSPQAIGLFFYLVLVAVTLRWLSARDPADGAPAIGLTRRAAARQLLRRLFVLEPMRAAELTPTRRAGLVAILIVAFVFLVTAHQLTPFFFVGAITTLVILRRVRWIGLPVLLTVIIGSWVSFMAVAFLIGHFQNVAGYVGAFSESLTANLTGRLQGSDGHRTVVLLRLVVTALVWAFAGLGVVRRIRTGRWDLVAVALAVAPVPLFAAQAYGGEMLLRIYLFGLPFMAFLGAAFFLPQASDRPPILTAGVVLVASAALMGAFIVGRYGNEPMEYFTRNEVAAVDELYRVAPEGAQLVAATSNLPWKSSRYELFHYRPIGDDTYVGKVDELILNMEEYSGPSYLILTRSQEAYAELILGVTPAAWTAFRAEVLATGRFRVVYENPDALIARFLAPGSSG